MTRSNPPSLYDEDFFLWTQQQAAALRAGAPGDDVDIAHVAEEIEDLGKRDLREVKSFVRLIYLHLMKIEARQDSSSVLHWRLEILNFRRSARDAFTPGMRQLLDNDELWQEAWQALDEDMREKGAIAPPRKICPLSLSTVLAPEFDLDAALARLAAAAFEASAAKTST